MKPIDFSQNTCFPASKASNTILQCELREKGDFWLSETPDVPSKGWDAVLPRICSWGHDYLGFEHFNERAFLSNDGWKLVRPKNNSQWELYNLNEDRSEQHDLAAKYPEKVAEMSKAYEAWAKRCMVEPYPGQKKK